MVQEKWLVEPGEAKTIDLELVRSLKVGLVGGNVDVIAHDEPGCRVEVYGVTVKELLVRLDGDHLEIDHLQKRWAENFVEAFRLWTGRARADVSVLVPRDVHVRLGVVTASAFVAGIREGAKLSTVSGDLVADETAGVLELNSVSGEISAREHAGRIRLHTVSGDVTASGAITRFSGDGVSSDVFLDLSGEPEEVAVNTVSGDLTIRVAEGLGARYRVNSVSGRLQFDDVYYKTQGGKPFTHQSGSQDGRRLDVSLNTVTGNVAVVRRPGSAAAADAAAAGISATGAEPSGTEPSGASA